MVRILKSNLSNDLFIFNQMMDSTELSSVKDEEIDLTDTEVDNEDSGSSVSVQSVDNNDSTHESDEGMQPPRVSEPVVNVLIQEHDESTSDPSNDGDIPSWRATDDVSSVQAPIIANNAMLKQLVDSQPTRRSNAGRKRIYDDDERRERYNAYHRHLYQKQKLERQKKDKELALLKHKLNLLTSRSSERERSLSAQERSLNAPMSKQTVSRFESSFQATPYNSTYVWTYSGSNGDSAVEEFNSMEQMADALRDMCCALQRKGVLSTFSLTLK